VAVGVAIGAAVCAAVDVAASAPALVASFCDTLGGVVTALEIIPPVEGVAPDSVDVAAVGTEAGGGAAAAFNWFRYDAALPTASVVPCGIHSPTDGAAVILPAVDVASADAFVAATGFVLAAVLAVAAFGSVIAPLIIPVVELVAAAIIYPVVRWRVSSRLRSGYLRRST
jgi:hypothetical protein